jgi:hypothetical protein
LELVKIVAALKDTDQGTLAAVTDAARGVSFGGIRQGEGFGGDSSGPGWCGLCGERVAGRKASGMTGREGVVENDG